MLRIITQSRSPAKKGSTEARRHMYEIACFVSQTCDVRARRKIASQRVGLQVVCVRLWPGICALHLDDQVGRPARERWLYAKLILQTISLCETSNTHTAKVHHVADGDVGEPPHIFTTLCKSRAVTLLV
jgi:hypothetical protein